MPRHVPLLAAGFQQQDHFRIGVVAKGDDRSINGPALRAAVACELFRQEPQLPGPAVGISGRAFREFGTEPSSERFHLSQPLGRRICGLWRMSEWQELATLLGRLPDRDVLLNSLESAG